MLCELLHMIGNLWTTCICLMVLISKTCFGSTYEFAATMKAKRLSFRTTLGVGVVSFF